MKALADNRENGLGTPELSGNQLAIDWMMRSNRGVRDL